ncbi:MAG: hypothetical protein DPW16_09460 [Chloroflexi bacterium]|nr:hypothetical protein [Chloroflexota bacterium]
MNLAEYWQQPLSGIINRRGTQTDWLEVAEIEITTGILAIGDTMVFPHDQVQTNVSNGVYHIQAIVRDYGVERRIARLRVLLKNQNATRQPDAIAHFPVDFAGVGVCDYPAFSEAFETTFTCQDEKQAHYISHLWGDYGVVRVAGLPMVYTKAGWGSGIYEAFPYVDESNRLVGIEAVFIEDDSHLMEDVEQLEINSLRELRDRANERLDDRD